MARGTINLERDLAGDQVAARFLRYADDVAARLLRYGAAVSGGTGFKFAWRLRADAATPTSNSNSKNQP